MKTYSHAGTTGSNMRMRRLLSVLLDAFLCFVLGYACYTMLWTCAGFDYTEVVTSLKQVIFDASPIYLTFFFFKDVFGRSIGKMIFGLYIVEKGTSERASFGKRFFRNFSLMIFPIEGIFVLISETNTRLADKLLEIEVVREK